MNLKTGLKLYRYGRSHLGEPQPRLFAHEIAWIRDTHVGVSDGKTVVSRMTPYQVATAYALTEKDAIDRFIADQEEKLKGDDGEIDSLLSEIDAVREVKAQRLKDIAAAQAALS